MRDTFDGSTMTVRWALFLVSWALLLASLLDCATGARLVLPKRRPAARTAVRRVHHPSLGRGNAYSHDLRLFVMRAYDLGQGNAPILAQLRNSRLLPQRSTVNRWRNRRLTLGHLRRFRRQGNRYATVLRGRSLFNLAYYRILYPKATAAELNVFLFYATGRLYNPSQITRAEQRLGLSRKRGSTTARQANHPRNLQWRHNYWTLPYPFGMVGIRRDDIIDLDECGVFVESCNRNHGKAAICRRVREEGNYGHSAKLNVLMAISGAPGTLAAQAERWVMTWTHGGTTTARFIQFIQKILADIGQGNPLRRRVFTMDNLSAHR